MITDLLRHDLGQHAILGSVCVPATASLKLFASASNGRTVGGSG